MGKPQACPYSPVTGTGKPPCTGDGRAASVGTRNRERNERLAMAPHSKSTMVPAGTDAVSATWLGVTREARRRGGGTEGSRPPAAVVSLGVCVAHARLGQRA